MNIFETKRLKFHNFIKDDVGVMSKLFSDFEVMRHYNILRTADESKAWIEKNIECYKTDNWGYWAVELKTSPGMIGQCGFMRRQIEQNQEIELGYMFFPEVWGQGFATEAAIACKNYAFHQLNFNKLISLIVPENIASIRVAEKIGMQYERTINFKEKLFLLEMTLMFQ